jgi:hypothetical protein
MPTPPPPAAKPPLRIVDLVIGILLAIVTGLVGIIMLGLIPQLGNLSQECEGIAADGARCNPDFLSGVIIVGVAIVIFGWFITTGLIVVRAIRRKLVFFLPLIGFVVMIAAFYIVTAVLGTSYLPQT